MTRLINQPLVKGTDDAYIQNELLEPDTRAGLAKIDGLVDKTSDLVYHDEPNWVPDTSGARLHVGIGRPSSPSGQTYTASHTYANTDTLEYAILRIASTANPANYRFRLRDTDDSYTTYTDGTLLRRIATTGNFSYYGGNLHGGARPDSVLTIEFHDGEIQFTTYPGDHLYSGTAPDGQVSVADGAGGSEWRDQTGGLQTVETDDTLDGDGTTGDPLGVADDSIGSDHIQTDAVTPRETNISDGDEDVANTSFKAILAEGVNENAFLRSRLPTDALLDRSVTNLKIARETITDMELADDSVQPRHIRDGTIRRHHLGRASFSDLSSLRVVKARPGDDDTTGFVFERIAETDMEDNSVSSDKIRTHAVTEPKLAPRSVRADKVDPGTAADGHVLTSDGGGNASWEEVAASTPAGDYIERDEFEQLIRAGSVAGDLVAGNHVTDNELFGANRSIDSLAYFRDVLYGFSIDGTDSIHINRERAIFDPQAEARVYVPTLDDRHLYYVTRTPGGTSTLRIHRNTTGYPRTGNRLVFTNESQKYFTALCPDSSTGPTENNTHLFALIAELDTNLLTVRRYAVGQDTLTQDRSQSLSHAQVRQACREAVHDDQATLNVLHSPADRDGAVGLIVTGGRLQILVTGIGKSDGTRRSAIIGYDIDPAGGIAGRRPSLDYELHQSTDLLSMAGRIDLAEAAGGDYIEDLWIAGVRNYAYHYVDPIQLHTRWPNVLGRPDRPDAAEIAAGVSNNESTPSVSDVLAIVDANARITTDTIVDDTITDADLAPALRNEIARGGVFLRGLQLRINDSATSSNSARSTDWVGGAFRVNKTVYMNGGAFRITENNPSTERTYHLSIVKLFRHAADDYRYGNDEPDVPYWDTRINRDGDGFDSNWDDHYTLSPGHAAHGYMESRLPDPQQPLVVSAGEYIGFMSRVRTNGVDNQYYAIDFISGGDIDAVTEQDHFHPDFDQEIFTYVGEIHSGHNGRDLQGRNIMTASNVDHFAYRMHLDYALHSAEAGTVESDDIDSTGAADGAVLTADGAGNSSWEEMMAGGGLSPTLVGSGTVTFAAWARYATDINSPNIVIPENGFGMFQLRATSNTDIFSGIWNIVDFAQLRGLASSSYGGNTNNRIELPWRSSSSFNISFQIGRTNSNELLVAVAGGGGNNWQFYGGLLNVYSLTEDGGGGGGGGGLSAVEHDTTLDGTGTAAMPLSVADNSLVEGKLAIANDPEAGHFLSHDGNNMLWSPMSSQAAGATSVGAGHYVVNLYQTLADGITPTFPNDSPVDSNNDLRTAWSGGWLVGRIVTVPTGQALWWATGTYSIDDIGGFSDVSWIIQAVEQVQYSSDRVVVTDDYVGTGPNRSRYERSRLVDGRFSPWRPLDDETNGWVDPGFGDMSAWGTGGISSRRYRISNFDLTHFTEMRVDVIAFGTYDDDGEIDNVGASGTIHFERLDDGWTEKINDLSTGLALGSYKLRLDDQLGLNAVQCGSDHVDTQQEANFYAATDEPERRMSFNISLHGTAANRITDLQISGFPADWAKCILRTWFR